MDDIIAFIDASANLDLITAATKISACHSIDGEKLKKGNYIDGACLFKRSAFCGFDTTLKRFLDWDLFLNLYINKGISGVYCNKTTYMAFYLDEGISSIHNSKEDAIQVIKTKYNLNG